MRLMGRVGFHSALSAGGAAKAAAKSERSIALRTRICVMAPSSAACDPLWLPPGNMLPTCHASKRLFWRALARNSPIGMPPPRSPVLGERLNGGLARMSAMKPLVPYVMEQIPVGGNAPPSIVLTDEDVRKRLSV